MNLGLLGQYIPTKEALTVDLGSVPPRPKCPDLPVETMLLPSWGSTSLVSSDRRPPSTDVHAKMASR